jgi:hypothetical protein
MSPEHGGDIKFPPALSLSVTLPSCENSHSDTKAEPVLAMAMEEDGNVSVPHPSTSASALSENWPSSTMSASALLVSSEPSGDITSINDVVVDADNECPLQDASSTVPTATSVVDFEVLSDGVYGFVDIIDMSCHTFLSYNTVLRLVYPVNRYGFAVVFQCNLENELHEGFKQLLNITRIPPRNTFFNETTSFVSNLSDERRDIRFVSRPHTDAMKAERSLYKQQLHQMEDVRIDFIM